MNITYEKYLHLDKLLHAQEPQSENEHDEMLFIIIHQSYELWFKQILHEMQELKRAFRQGHYPKAHDLLNRILTILKILVNKVDIIETLTPLSFLKFRSLLDNASGFQSLQYYLVELNLGLSDGLKAKYFEPDSESFKKITETLAQPTLYQSLLMFLSRMNYAHIPDELFHRKSLKLDENLVGIFSTLYKEKPELGTILERFVDLDEGFQEWRYRHVKMVERTIGNKIGTGGSSGVEFLKNKIWSQAFPELWAARATW